MKAKIYFNGITYVARRKYIYRYDVNNDKVMKFSLTDVEKESIRNFVDDPYDDSKEWRFLNEVWYSHDDYENGNALPARYRDFWG